MQKTLEKQLDSVNHKINKIMEELNIKDCDSQVRLSASAVRKKHIRIFFLTLIKITVKRDFFGEENGRICSYLFFCL